MVRLFHTYFPVRTVLLALIEAIVTALGFFVARGLWAERGGLEPGYAKIAVVGCVLALCMYYYDLYESRVLGNFAAVATRLIQVLGASCVILSVLYLAYPEWRLNLSVLLIGFLAAGLGLVLCRSVFLAVARSPRMGRRALFFGMSPLSSVLASEMAARPDLGIRAVGYVGVAGDESLGSGALAQVGTADELFSLVEREQIDDVIVTMDERRGRLPMESLFCLRKHGVRVMRGPDFYESVTGKVFLDGFDWSSLVFSSQSLFSRATLVLKRVISIVGAAIGLILFFPVMLVIAAAIRLDSAGDVVFRQQRVGKDGRLFTLFKFRSMRVGADEDGIPTPVREDDHRLTKVGRWLRRSRFDELPQFINILRGDIDFVGPRPFVPNQETEMAEKIPFYRRRWDVRPGATGWAQVNRGYCATVEDNAEKLSYDLYYVKNMSLGFDLFILFKTAKTVILGRGGR